MRQDFHRFSSSVLTMASRLTPSIVRPRFSSIQALRAPRTRGFCLTAASRSDALMVVRQQPFCEVEDGLRLSKRAR